MVHVRGHHLLCLLTYVGRGYSPQFVQAMDALAQHVALGKPIQLCIGPDVLCASLQDADATCQAHCQLARNAQRDRTALAEIARLLERPLHETAHICLTAQDIHTLRGALQPLDAQASLRGVRAACDKCEWLGLCRDVTQAQFAQTRLQT